jgi:hypothetical protein
MRYPSDDPKPLVWGRYPHSLNDLTQTRNIQSRGYQLLHVVFSDSDFVTTPVAAPTRYACISKVETLQPLDVATGLPITRPEGVANELRVEDSFTNGIFHIEITVTSDEGAYKKAAFKLTVDEDFAGLTMQKKSWFRCKLQ